MKIIRIRAIAGLENPAVDLIPDSAIQKSGKPFFKPEFAESFRFKTAVAVHICRLGKNIAPKFASRYYDEAGLCLAIEATPLLGLLHDCGAPWSLATAFDGAVIAGEFFPSGSCRLGEGQARLKIGDVEADCFPLPSPDRFDNLIAYVSKYFTLKIGDILLVDGGQWHDIVIDDRICADINGLESINLKIK